MGMDLVVVLDPSRDLPERGFGVRQGVQAQIVALEGLHEGLGHAVGLRAPDRSEAGNEVQGYGEVPGFLGRVGAAIVGEMLDGLGRFGDPKAPFDGGLS